MVVPQCTRLDGGASALRTRWCCLNGHSVFL